MSMLMCLTAFLLGSCSDQKDLEIFTKSKEPRPEDVSHVVGKDSVCQREFQHLNLKTAVVDSWSENYLVYLKDATKDPVTVGPKSWNSADTLFLPVPREVFLANCKRFMQKPAPEIAIHDNGLAVNWLFSKTRVNFSTLHDWPAAAVDTVKISGVALKRHRYAIDSLIWVKTDTTRILNPDTLNGQYLVREIVLHGKLRMNGGSPVNDDFKAIIRGVVTKDGSEPINPGDDDELIGLERGDETPECDYAKTIRDHEVKETADSIFGIDRYKRPIIHRYSVSGGTGIIWKDTLHAKIALPKMSRVFMSELSFKKESESYKAGVGKMNGKTFWSRVSGIYFEFPTSFEKSVYEFGGFSLDFNRETEYFYWNAIAYKSTESVFDLEIYVDGVKYKLYQAKHLFEASYSDGSKYQFKIPQEVCIKADNGGGPVNPDNPLAALEELEKSSTNQVEFTLADLILSAKNSWKHHINRRYRDGSSRDTIWETTEYAKIYLPKVEKRIVESLDDFVKNGESWQPGSEHNGKTFWTIVSGTKFIFPTDYEQRTFTHQGMSIKLSCYGYWSAVNYLETSIVSQKGDVVENGVTYHVYEASHKFRASYSNGESYEFAIPQEIWLKTAKDENDLTGLREKSGKAVGFRIEKSQNQINGIEDYEFTIERIYKTGVVDTIWLNTTKASIYLPSLPEAVRETTDIIKNSQNSYAGTNYNGKTFAFVLSGTPVNFETSFEKSEFFWKGFGVKLSEYGYWKNISYLSSSVNGQLADRMQNGVKYHVYEVWHKFKAAYSNSQETEFTLPQLILIQAKDEDELLDTYVKSRLEWRGNDLYSVNEIYESRRLSGEKLVENKEVNLQWNVYGEALKTVYNARHDVSSQGATVSSSFENVNVSGCKGAKTKKVFVYDFGYFTSQLENTAITSLTYEKNGKTLVLAAADANLLTSAYDGFDQDASPTLVSANGREYNEWPTIVHLLGNYDTQSARVNNSVKIRVEKGTDPTYPGYTVVAAESGMTLVYEPNWGIYLSRIVTFRKDDGSEKFSVMDVWVSDKNASKREQVVSGRRVQNNGHAYLCATPQDGAQPDDNKVVRSWRLGYLEALSGGSLTDAKVETWQQVGFENGAQPRLVVSKAMAHSTGVLTPIVSRGTYNSSTGVFVLDGVSYK